MRTIARFTALALAGLLAAGLAACAPTADAPDTTAAPTDGESLSLSLGRLGVGGDASILIAREHGMYDEHNLTVNDTVVANPPAALAAVQSGQLDVAYTTVMAYLQAVSQGVPLVAVTAADGTGIAEPGQTDLAPLDPSGLFVNPASGITRPGELAGRTVSVLARNGSLELGVAAAVRADGGDPSTINWVTLDFASAVSSLEAGNVDAAALVMPFTNEALDKGMTQISAPVVELFGQGAVTALWVSTQATIDAKQPAIDAFIESQHDAANYANENTLEAMEKAKEITGIGLAAEEMTPIYWVPSLDPAQLDEQARIMFDLGYLTSELDLTGKVYEGA